MSQECMFSGVPTLGRIFRDKSSWSKGPPTCTEVILSLSDRNSFSVCNVMTCCLLSVCFHIHVGTRIEIVTLTGWGCFQTLRDTGAVAEVESHWFPTIWAGFLHRSGWDLRKEESGNVGSGTEIGVVFSEVRWGEAVQFWGPCFLQVQAILVCLGTLSCHIKSSSLGG